MNAEPASVLVPMSLINEARATETESPRGSQECILDIRLWL